MMLEVGPRKGTDALPRVRRRHALGAAHEGWPLRCVEQKTRRDVERLLYEIADAPLRYVLYMQIQYSHVSCHVIILSNYLRAPAQSPAPRGGEHPHPPRGVGRGGWGRVPMDRGKDPGSWRGPLVQ